MPDQAVRKQNRSNERKAEIGEEVSLQVIDDHTVGADTVTLLQEGDELFVAHMMGDEHCRDDLKALVWGLCLIGDVLSAIVLLGVDNRFFGNVDSGDLCRWKPLLQLAAEIATATTDL